MEINSRSRLTETTEKSQRGTEKNRHNFIYERNMIGNDLRKEWNADTHSPLGTD